MPYIPVDDRDRLDDEKLVACAPQNVGELTYAVTRLLFNYIRVHGLRYQQIADIMAACNNSGLEFYRRVAVPYEDKKARLNGGIQP